MEDIELVEQQTNQSDFALKIYDMDWWMFTQEEEEVHLRLSQRTHNLYDLHSVYTGIRAARHDKKTTEPIINSHAVYTGRCAIWHVTTNPWQ